jgi:hypothetical protein
MALDVSFENGIIVAETHLPIVDYIVVDGVIFVDVLLGEDRLDVALHEQRPFLLDLQPDAVLLLLPQRLVLPVPLQIALLFGQLHLLVLQQTRQDRIAVDRRVEHVLRSRRLIEGCHLLRLLTLLNLFLYVLSQRLHHQLLS